MTKKKKVSVNRDDLLVRNALSVVMSFSCVGYDNIPAELVTVMLKKYSGGCL